MPALPNVNKVIRLDFLFSLAGGVPALSHQYYHYSGTAPSTTDIVTFADNAVAAFTAAPLNDMTQDYTFLGVEATDLTTPTSAQGNSPVNVAGGNNTQAIANDVAFVCAYEIARRYRGGHPRGYWPLGTEADSADERTWQSGSVSTFTTDLASMQTSIIAGGWGSAGTIKQVTVSYFHGFTVVTSPTTGRARNVPTLRAVPLVDDVLAYAGRQLYGNQRRRLGR